MRERSVSVGEPHIAPARGGYVERERDRVPAPATFDVRLRPGGDFEFDWIKRDLTHDDVSGARRLHAHLSFRGGCGIWNGEADTTLRESLFSLTRVHIRGDSSKS